MRWTALPEQMNARYTRWQEIVTDAKRLGELLFSPLLLAVLVALLFSTKTNWGIPPPPRVWTRFEVPSDRAFFGSMAAPAVAQLEGYLALSGWVAPVSSQVHVVKAEVMVDGLVLATIEDFEYRPDVAAAFGRPDFQQSGWHCVISPKKLKPGDYKLQVRVTGSDGAAEVAISKNLTIVE